jgi:hypothetical protein
MREPFQNRDPPKTARAGWPSTTHIFHEDATKISNKHFTKSETFQSNQMDLSSLSNLRAHTYVDALCFVSSSFIVRHLGFQQQKKLGLAASTFLLG